ncbi:glycosyltransferase family 2 protein [Candidatus Gottesmanbacteria bacterium]|nr:glycosyltransferase family 2 protein [Candidatus Gottesmanbacteria bacterium]
MKNYKLTIGIPTYYGGQSLVKTVKNILASKEVPAFRLIVTVDGNPLETKIYKQLKDLGVEVLNNKDRKGQVGRIKQLIKITKSGYLILTQDDVIYESTTVKKMLNTLENDKKITMAAAKVLPVKSNSLLESVLEVGVDLNYRIGNSWNYGSNYLLASGRCLAFKTDFIKKFTVPEQVINSDAYLYFENKRHGGIFKFIENAKVYIKSPQTLKEHIKQSKKFQYSQQEISQISKDLNLENEYHIPTELIIKSYLEEFLLNPFYSFLYFADFIYTRTQMKNMYANKSRFWETDKSTKQI